MLKRVIMALFCLAVAGVVGAEEFNPENALWEVFTHTGSVTSMTYSTDRNILWVGTEGGLEERDAATGQRLRLYTNLDGLPDNRVQALLADASGGLWVGTDRGLACLSISGEWQVYNRDNSELPSNQIYSLQPDMAGGLWIGISGGLAHLDAFGEWRVYHAHNSGLPGYNVKTLYSDEVGGLWVGTLEDGLAYRNASGQWRVYQASNSGLPHNDVRSLQPDGAGGLWIGTYGGGLAHRNASGNWQVFTEENSDLPDNSVWSLYSDEAGGLWIGTSSGLAYQSAAGQWQVYTTDNSDLPHRLVSFVEPDGAGGLWIGTRNGLAHRHISGEWQDHTGDDSGLPGNNVISLQSDGAGGLWIGTIGGLVHRNAGGDWQVYTTDNSGMPDYRVNSLASDGAGGLWIGTWRGLAHRDVSGDWQVYTHFDSGLPSDIVTCLHSDASGGLWVGTIEEHGSKFAGGLAYRTAAGDWQVYTTNNSELPENNVESLVSDGAGGLWVGTGNPFVPDSAGGGLAHRNASGNWQVFTTENSGLPGNRVSTLAPDRASGLWIGTSNGLAHRSASGNWQVFTKDNSDLPGNSVRNLHSDESGGLWVGSFYGLAHLDPFGEWQVYTTDNSGVPGGVIRFQPDDTGGLWIGTHRGLARLSFGYKVELPDLPEAERAAILIHPKGFNRNDTFAIETMTVHAYNTLLRRGFDNNEIYFLSHTPFIDITGDGRPDFHVVNAPVTLQQFRSDGAELKDSLTVDDVAQALEWAKEKGRLDQPLYIIFIGHGLSGRLRLDDMHSMLEAAAFHSLLNDYQLATGNQVVVILEACYAGTMLPALASPDRIVIASTGDTQAVYTENGIGSFSRHFFSELFVNHSFYDAFQTVSDRLPSFGQAFERQIPQIYDGPDLARQLHLNGNFSTLDGPVILRPVTAPRVVTAAEPLNLEVQVGYSESRLDVWALVLTPEYVQQRDANGFFMQPAPRVNLTSDDNITFRGTFRGFQYRGDYVVTFHARDRQGFVSSSEPLTFSLPQGPDPLATPVPSQALYQSGDPLHITVPAVSGPTSQYVALMVPGLDGLLMVTDTNAFSMFEGRLNPWSGGDLVVDLPNVAGLPLGIYTTFLLRVPAGVDPLVNPDAWKLGQVTFEVE